MPIKNIEKFASTDAFLAASPDTGNAQGIGAVDDDLVVNVGGTAKTIPVTEVAAVTTTQWTALAAIPTADQNDSVTIWNDGGVLKVSSAP